jgi:hypothetical protein
MANIPLQHLIDEVQNGLASEAKERITDAQRALDFFNFEGKRWMQEFLNDAETAFDYLKRPYRASGLAWEVVDILTEHLYSPGPNRQWDVPAGHAFLERAWNDNYIDAVMLEADQLSTLSDCVAIQVDADEGRFDERAITLRVWGADEFHAWEDPDNRAAVEAVCTIDRYDATTRYRLWTEDEVITFHSRKFDGQSGGRVALETGREKNTYGCVPFSFVHYRQPIRQFWQPGISRLVVEGEIRVNDRLSRLDQSINKHLNPIAYAKNLPDGAQVIAGQPNLFVRLPNRAMVPDGTGGYRQSLPPELGYLQATIDVAGAWEDITKYINQVLEAARVPMTAVRMEQTGVASGIALIVEQAPLLTRARKRRLPFSIYESNLARTILRCAGNHYGRPELVSAAKKGKLTLGWPSPSIPVPTDDWWDLEVKKVQAGAKSMLMLVQELYGVPREQAMTILRQVKEDQDEVAKIMPDASMAARPEGEDDDDGSPPDDASREIDHGTGEDDDLDEYDEGGGDE